MSFMKMASMASVAIIIVIGMVMVDVAMPDSFFQLLLMVALAALTMFFGYRLFVSARALQGKAAASPDFRGVLALGLIVLVMAGTLFYLLLNPVWDSRVLIAGGWIVFLVFLISRLALQINLLPLLGIKDDSST